MSEGIVTSCFGDLAYQRFAVTLARCLAIHAADVPRAVVTDSPEAPELHRHFDHVIPAGPELREGGVFIAKLRLHRYSPFARTLYVDADSLVVRSLTEVLEAFRGRPFSVVAGDSSYTGHWFDQANLPAARRRPEYPVFNGGVLYFEGDGGGVFDDAATMLESYAEWQIATIDGHLNDEPLLAIAMATAGFGGVRDQGRIMRTLAGLEGPLRVDVLRGESLFVSYGAEVTPAIVHFASGAWRALEYRREAARLALRERGVPAAVLAALPPVSRAMATAVRPFRRRRSGTRSLAVRDSATGSGGDAPG